MPYCEDADLDQTFGPENIKAWADLDEDGDAGKIAARKAVARAIADEEIDDVARTAPYGLPLTTPAGTVPTTIRYLAATLAGIWLYEARGVADFAPDSGRPYHRLAYKRRWAKDMLEEIRDGRRKLNTG